MTEVLMVTGFVLVAYRGHRRLFAIEVLLTMQGVILYQLGGAFSAWSPRRP